MRLLFPRPAGQGGAAVAHLRAGIVKIAFVTEAPGR